jgi:hypothetical protein
MSYLIYFHVFLYFLIIFYDKTSASCIKVQNITTNKVTCDANIVCYQDNMIVDPVTCECRCTDGYDFDYMTYECVYLYNCPYLPPCETVFFERDFENCVCKCPPGLRYDPTPSYGGCICDVKCDTSKNYELTFEQVFCRNGYVYYEHVDGCVVEHMMIIIVIIANVI